MTARGKIMNPEEVEVFHCYSRCVRRAWLCGGEFEHRRAILRDLIMLCANEMAIDLGGYAILVNHFHMILRSRPDLAMTWTDLEVAQHWFALYPQSLRDVAKRKTKKLSPWLEGVDPSELSADEIVVRTVAGRKKLIKKLRKRLSSISWFNKRVKETMAKIANREDGVTGSFWDGRFKSPKLLDDKAVLIGMAYVDLNVIRAGQAQSLESSNFSSIQDRIQARQWVDHRQGKRRSAPKRAKKLFTRLELARDPKDAEDGLFLAPIQAKGGGPTDRGMTQVTLEEYLVIVDGMGRVVRPDKPGAIPEDLPPILEQIGIDTGRMAEEVRRFGERVGSVVGNAASRAREAARRGVKYVLGDFDVSPIPAASPGSPAPSASRASPASPASFETPASLGLEPDTS